MQWLAGGFHLAFPCGLRAIPVSDFSPRWDWVKLQLKNQFDYQINSGNADLILENKQLFIFWEKSVKQIIRGNLIQNLFSSVTGWHKAVKGT